MKKNSFLTSMLAATLLAATNIGFSAERTVVKDGETINFQDETFNNIQYEGSGGAIYVEGEGRIENITSSTFEGNTAQNGGAIATKYWIGDEYISSPIIGAINDSIFTNNTASGFASSYENEENIYNYLNGSGGAISSGFVINEINNTVFSNNCVDVNFTGEDQQYNLLNVTADGGAISGRVANIVNSTFSNNFVNSNGRSSGGALSLAGNYLYKFTEQGTEVTKLPAFNIKDSTFENNRAEGLYATGGALTARGEVNITNTKFTSNKAENAGGAIYLQGISERLYNTDETDGSQQLVATIFSDAVIKDSIFENNSVTNDKASDIYSNYYIDGMGTETAEGYYTTTPQGGAVYSGGKLSIDNTVFKGNSALKVVENNYSNGNSSYYEGKGGAIYNTGEASDEISYYPELSVTNSVFENNNSAEGGAIYNEGTIKEFTGNTFIGNNALQEDQSVNVYTHDDNGVTVIQNIVYKSHSGSGGAIYNKGGDLSISDSTFENNTAAYGGAIYNEIGAGSLNIKDSKFINNSSYNEGSDSGSITVGDETYTWNNESYGLGSGGAIVSYADTIIENSEFEGNTTGGDGGAIYAASNLTVKNSSFKNNTAKADNYGTTYTYNGNGEVLKEDYEFHDGYGGAISHGQGDLTISNSMFENNIAGGEGGGAISSGGNINITGSIFNSNSTYGDGGAISSKYIYDTNNKIIITNSEFNVNNVKSEYGISWNNDEHTEVANPAAGGAINTNVAELNISNSKFNNNFVDLSGENLNSEEMAMYSGLGGAINSESKIAVTNSEFSGNKVSVKYTENFDYTSEDGIREQYVFNGETGTGGAINNTGELTITGSKFTENNASFGGAINNVGTTVIMDSEFTGNVSNSLETSNSTFTYKDQEYKSDNTYYNGHGGAVSSEGDLTVENSTFSGNIAAESGGAIDACNGNVTIKNSIFNNNIAKSQTKEGYYSVDENDEVIYNDISYIEGYGGAITVEGTDEFKLTIDDSYFEGNISGEDGGGAIATFVDTEINNSIFKNNQSEGFGGAIYGGINTANELKITDTDFINNSAQEGGALAVGNEYNKTELSITALNKDVEFSGNSAEKGADIYAVNTNINLNANEGKTISFDGGIVGQNSSIIINDQAKQLYDDMTSTGKIVIDNFVSPDENSSLAVNLNAGTLALTKENYLDGTDLTLEEGSTLDLTNKSVGTMNLNSLTSNNANLNIDADLASSENVFDMINAKTASGTLNLKNVNLISDFSDSQNEFTVTLPTQEGFELKLPENGINAITNDYVYTIDTSDGKFSVNRLVDDNGNAIKTDGFTISVNQTDKVGGFDVKLSEDRSYSANSDIKITENNLEKGWTGNLGGKSLTINGNGYTLDGEKHTGIAVGDKQSLTFNDTNIKGFETSKDRKGALTVNNGGTLNINAVNYDVSLGKNSDSDVIYLDGTNSSANLLTENEKEINVNGNIISANKSNNLKLTGNGKITFNGIVDPLTLTNENKETVHNNYIDDVTYNLNSGMVTFTKDEYLNGQGNKNTLNFNGGTLNLANGAVGTINLAALNINSNSNIMVDADLAKETMDSFTADSATAAKGAILNVSHINLLSDAVKETVEINAVDPAITLGENDTLASHITTSVKEVAYSPIYKYGVGYDPTTGNFTFSRGSSKDYNNVNPSIMVSPVAAQLGGYMGMLDTYNNAFSNMDMRMLLPSTVRVAQKNANKYAITDTKGADFATNETNSGGTWVRPFAAYDSVGLKNGPKVHNMSYGSFIGGDTAVHQFANGAEGVLSAHVSYLGSHQSFAGNSIYQNGGNIGLTGTLYKGNFFSGLSLNTGASVADASTMYGNEDFPMFMAGIANKTGYNIEFKEGKFIIQPSLLLSYTFVNTFNYTNASGVKIDGDPLHALQISPNVRFAFNTKNGWQPYLTAGMNWNIMNSSEFMANAAELPSLSVKPYVQYGFGLQKTVNDNFTAYAQVLLRNGGRNGIAANAGMKYLFGHESRLKENI